MTDFSRRTTLVLAGLAALFLGGPAIAQDGAVCGTVTYEGGAAIPEGRLRITLEATAGADRGKRPAATAESDGSTREIPFTITAPSGAGGTLVARLERADGWLLARGAAPLEDGAPVTITLNTVMY
jgi:hypothetical protein